LLAVCQLSLTIFESPITANYECPTCGMNCHLGYGLPFCDLSIAVLSSH
jgi:hypothetical protein